MRTPRFGFAAALLVLSAISPASAAEKRHEPVGAMTARAAAVEWTVTLGGYEKLVLTVASPDGSVYTREFSLGSRPSFAPQDVPAGALVDGTYTYDLRVVPRVPPEVARQMAAARAAGDEAEASRLQRAAGLGVAIVQSGAFSVRSGSFVPSDGNEPTNRRNTTEAMSAKTPSGSSTPVTTTDDPPVRTMDQVIPDDLIVQGSLCVGLNCVNNESFGFDTIRMKEDNTRVKFEDTSTSTGFPTVDWQLTANDSASGGQAKFSIEDITNARVPFTVEAAATTNSIYVDSTGRVGFRTSTPVLDLHVNTSNTPALRLEQNNSGGFTAQTWDVAGNEANFFVRDVTGGSRLPLRIRPGAPTSSIDIAANGYVGVGTAAPSAKLHVSGLGAVLKLQDTSSTSTVPSIASHVSFVDSAGSEYAWFGDGSTGTNFMTLYAAASHGLRIYSGGNSAMHIPTSGFVGMGTESPLSKLHVFNGDIRVTNGAFIDDGVTLNAPDYVFEESYELMPLASLAEYVRQEKHLPNVPSAAEIKQNGLNVSQFQMRLLEKIEELTLYTVQQHGHISTLQAENTRLDERLKELEKKLEQLSAKLP